ncbi:MAG: tRNA lysidine(34) synthetase TilS [Myxococcota bacterium]|nr:tRNA lysidine(34) synthetase TilS [Myxococcota bacterium]
MDEVVKVMSTALQSLPEGPKRLLLATSGGPDSQCLMHAMAALRDQEPGLELHAVGLDHGLRPEAKTELDIAKTLAEEKKIPFHIGSLELTGTGNLLADARRSRYSYLQNFADRYGLSAVVTGHTATDQVETVLLNLSRGSGLQGARGMAPLSRGIFRPMLAISRPEVLAYLHRHNIPYANDPSNASLDRARGQIRASILPALRLLNSRAEQHFTAFARTAGEAEDFLRATAEAQCHSRSRPAGGLHAAGLSQEHPALRSAILQTWLKRVGLPYSRTILNQLVELLTKRSGKLSIDGDLIEHTDSTLWRLDRQAYSHSLKIPGAVKLDHMGLEIEAKTTSTRALLKNDRDYQQQTRKFVAFDLNHLHLDLVVRAWQPGDTFKPFGLEGTTTVGDLFTNLKVARPLRPQWPVVVSGNEVVWVAGLRRSAVAPVTQATEDVVQLECRQSSEWSPWGIFDEGKR